MHFRAVLAAGTLLLAGFAAAAPQNDWPNDTYLPKEYPRGQCATICGPVVTFSVHCGNSDISCICDQPGAQKQVPECAKCSLLYKSDSEYSTFVQKMQHLQSTCGFPASKKQYSAASGLTCPAIGVGVVAAAAAYAAM